MDEDDKRGEKESFEADRQADAWQEFLVTGRPGALADYLKYNGPVDDGVRHAIIDILMKKSALLRKGKRNSWRDYKTFVQIDMFCLIEGISKTRACARYAKLTRQALRTVEIQYERGKRISDMDVLFAGPTGENEK